MGQTHHAFFSEPTPDSAPHFTSNLEDTKAKEGTDAKFTCAVEGEPTPEVTWLTNGNELKPSDGAVMGMEDGKATLLLKSVTPDNAGEVTCKVNIHRICRPSVPLLIAIFVANYMNAFQQLKSPNGIITETMLFFLQK